jgi:hypothetical protein
MTPEVTPRTWSQLHALSEAAAIEASLARYDGDSANANRLYAEAADYEEQALAVVDVTYGRTRGITAVSAVSLWYKAGQFERAGQLARTMLNDSTLPSYSRVELRELVEMVDEARGIWPIYRRKT